MRRARSKALLAVTSRRASKSRSKSGSRNKSRRSSTIGKMKSKSSDRTVSRAISGTLPAPKVVNNTYQKVGLMAAARLFLTKERMLEIAIGTVGAVAAQQLLYTPGFVSKVANIYLKMVAAAAFSQGQSKLFWRLQSLLSQSIRMALTMSNTAAKRLTMRRPRSRTKSRIRSTTRTKSKSKSKRM